MIFRFALVGLVSASLLLAIDADRDFSGKWILAEGARLSVPFEDTLTIEQTDTEIRCEAGGARWTYALNGTERKVQAGGETRNSEVKWEGAALLINTIVTGSHDYVIMDRWRLSRDHATLTVTRQIIRGVKQEEGSMAYRRDRHTAPPPVPTEEAAAPPPAPRPMPRLEPSPAVAPPPAAPVAPPAPSPAAAPEALVRRDTTPPLPAEVVIPAGTHIPLTFRNTVDTRHAHEGDRIYLQTAFPVAQDGRIILPRGTFVTGAVTQVKQAGHLGKGELFIRFDTLTLPNGKTRDLRSSLATDEQGRIDGDTGRRDAGNIGGSAGTGARVGGITGSAAGHGGMGAGIGGAAAGIASVLVSKSGDASLPQGTAVDMVLDRDLRLRGEELR